MKKFLTSILLAVLLVTNTAVLKAPVAQAGLFDWPPTIELPEFKLPEFRLPDFMNGMELLGGFEKIKNLLTGDEIDLRPVLPVTIFPKESVFTNIIRNVPGLATDFIDKLNPYKAAASIAHVILKLARPYIEPAIKSILPKDFKGGVYKYLEDVKRIMKEANSYPIIKDIILPLWEFLVGPIDDLAGEILDILAQEQMVFSEGGNGEGAKEGEITGGLPPVIVANPFVNQKPVGELKYISDIGVVKGWAYDPNDPASPINIRISVPDFGEAIVKAEPYQYDLELAGKQVFFYRIPSSWRDGKYHYLNAFAIDINDSSVEVELKESHKQYLLYEKGIGGIDTLKEREGIIQGWAIDPDQEKDAAEVKFYLENGTYLGNTLTNIRRDLKWLDIKGDRYVSFSRKEVGFEFKLDIDKLSDGINHTITAYVVDKKDNGGFRETSIGSIPFMYPERLPVRFEKDPVTIQQGRRIFNSIQGIGNKNHKIAVYLDSRLLDIKTGKFIDTNYERNYWFSVNEDKNGAKTRSFDFDFLIPADTGLGEHTITMESRESRWFGWIYSKSFKLNVVPHLQMTFTAPDTFTTEKEFEIKIDNIPPRIKLTGRDANMKIAEAMNLFGLDGFDYVQNQGLKENSDGTLSIRVNLPHEIAKIGMGPVIFDIGANYLNQAATEEMQGQSFSVKTKDGRNPIFEPPCKSVINPVLIMGGGAGKAVGKATGFSCFKKITVTISGVNNGKNFSVVMPSNYSPGDTTQEIPPLAYSPKTTGWDGNIENFTLSTTMNWARDYTTVEEITVTIKDEAGNIASARVNLSNPYKVRVVPLNKDEELKQGASIRLGTQNFTPGNLVKVTIDGKSAKEFYLNGKMNTTSELLSDPLNLPASISPGVHTITLEDLTQVDADGKIIYRAQSSFTVVGETTPKKPQIPPVVIVNPASAKTGEYIDINLTNFSPLGTVTIYLRQVVKPDEGGIKLSGFADYTDGAGALQKNVRIPEDVEAGKYLIIVTDIQGLSATANLDIEPAQIPKPAPKPAPVPAPGPKPTPAPQPWPQPKIDPTPPVNPQPEQIPVYRDPEVIPVKPTPMSDPILEPKQEETVTPTCPSGSTYSPTFKSCIKDAPPASEFEGKPCDKNIPMYVQKGCI